jgi:paraquat-inducible protein A
MRWVACTQCDLLQTLPLLKSGERALCARCDHVLMARGGADLQAPLALALTAFVLFIVANAHPLLVLELGGYRTESTLFGATLALWNEGMAPLALLVFCTTLLIPALEITGLLTLLMLASRKALPSSHRLVRLLDRIRPWSMSSIFLLGIFVSLVKLASVATIVVGPALWGISLFVVAMAAANARFEPCTLWYVLGHPELDKPKASASD